jgi:hypothetical protein
LYLLEFQDEMVTLYLQLEKVPIHGFEGEVVSVYPDEIRDDTCIAEVDFSVDGKRLQKLAKGLKSTIN